MNNTMKRLKPKSHSSDISLDSWGHILLYLDEVKDFCSVVYVVKGLLDFVRNVYSHSTSNIPFELKKSIPNVNQPQVSFLKIFNEKFMIKNYCGILYACFNCGDVEALLNLLFPKFSNLEKLVMYFNFKTPRMKWDVQEFRISQLKVKSPPLKVLRVFLTEFDVVISHHFSHLEELYLIRTTFESSIHKYSKDSLTVFEWDKTFPKLKKLELKGFKVEFKLGNNFREKIECVTLDNTLTSERSFQKCEKLRELKLHNESINLINELRELDQLHILEIRTTMNVYSDIQIIHLNFSIRDFPNLTELLIEEGNYSIGKCCNWSSSSSSIEGNDNPSKRLLIRNLKNLRKVRVYYVNLVIVLQDTPQITYIHFEHRLDAKIQHLQNKVLRKTFRLLGEIPGSGRKGNLTDIGVEVVNPTDLNCLKELYLSCSWANDTLLSTVFTSNNPVTCHVRNNIQKIYIFLERSDQEEDDEDSNGMDEDPFFDSYVRNLIQRNLLPLSFSNLDRLEFLAVRISNTCSIEKVENCPSLSRLETSDISNTFTVSGVPKLEDIRVYLDYKISRSCNNFFDQIESIDVKDLFLRNIPSCDIVVDSRIHQKLRCIDFGYLGTMHFSILNTSENESNIQFVGLECYGRAFLRVSGHSKLTELGLIILELDENHNNNETQKIIEIRDCENFRGFSVTVDRIDGNKFMINHSSRLGKIDLESLKKLQLLEIRGSYFYDFQDFRFPKSPNFVKKLAIELGRRVETNKNKNAEVGFEISDAHFPNLEELCITDHVDDLDDFDKVIRVKSISNLKKLERIRVSGIRHMYYPIFGSLKGMDHHKIGVRGTYVMLSQNFEEVMIKETEKSMNMYLKILLKRRIIKLSIKEFYDLTTLEFS